MIFQDNLANTVSLDPVIECCPDDLLCYFHRRTIKSLLIVLLYTLFPLPFYPSPKVHDTAQMPPDVLALSSEADWGRSGALADWLFQE